METQARAGRSRSLSLNAAAQIRPLTVLRTGELLADIVSCQDDFPPDLLTRSNEAELEFQSGSGYRVGFSEERSGRDGVDPAAAQV
jgi:hypothetical protein